MGRKNRAVSGLRRREFIYLGSASALALVAGCATNAVTGRKELMLVSEAQEISQDRQAAPHQFSADYGPVRDAALNAYVASVGQKVAAVSHRPGMPYSFHVVNAVYVNAYTFPGGSVVVTRGMMLQLKNEAELAAVLGHEIGHVNARHTARAMTWGMMGSLVVAGASAYAGGKNADYGTLAAGIGQLAEGALLARYSRANEREADELGLGYMVKAGYSPDGMVGLMEVLKGLSRTQPNFVAMMFATHPMSDERYDTAVNRANRNYAAAKSQPLEREGYLARTAPLRAMRPALEAMQKGEEDLAKNDLSAAQAQLNVALQAAPDDYCGLLLMSKCCLAGKRYAEARRYAERAQGVYPEEAQAYHLSGMAALAQKQFAPAYEEFSRYEQLLPGNPNTVFFKGYSLEGMGRKDESAQCYAQYLRAGSAGDYATHARAKLVEWGYMAQ